MQILIVRELNLLKYLDYFLELIKLYTTHKNIINIQTELH